MSDHQVNESTADDSSTRERNKAVIRRIYADGYSAGDESVFDECYTDDFAHHDKTVFDVGEGAEAERLSMRRFRQAIPDARFEVVHLLADGDRVAAQLRVTGTPVTGFPPIEATGEPIDFRSLAVFRLQDGRIAEEWFYRAAAELGGAHS